MWRNFSFPCMTIGGKLKISPHVDKFKMSPHDRCGEIWNSPHMACVWCRKRRHIFNFFAIYAVLLLNLLFTLFCREISCGEKFSPKVRLWRKNDKYEFWGKGQATKSDEFSERFQTAVDLNPQSLRMVPISEDHTIWPGHHTSLQIWLGVW